MLIPADFLSGALMPWVLAAPALPLAFLLFRKAVFNTLNIAMLIGCIISMLTNVFINLLVLQPADLQSNIYLLGLMIEFGVSMVLLWNCTHRKLIRGMILAVGVLFSGALASLMVMDTTFKDLLIVLNIGYWLIFFLAVTVLMMTAKDSANFLTNTPEFWVSAGLMYHFGLIGLLMLIHPGSTPAEWSTNNDFGLMYTIITCIRYLMFSASIMVSMKQFSNNNPTLFHIAEL